MVTEALRGVVRQALSEVVNQGLPGEHHFYLTFRTHAPGVDIPEFLRAQYPEEMTIVLQYQFYGLEVTDQGFGVTLSFGGKHERLIVPFSAITTFADPSVNFALQFQPMGTDMPEEEPAQNVVEPPTGTEDSPPSRIVVALDAFRKK